MNKKIFTIWFGMLAILFIPILYYSTFTPFALIDDLGDWKAISILHTPIEWLYNILFNYHQRFRPTWELYNALMWSIFGDHPYLHHLVRLGLKLLPIFFFYQTLKKLLNNQNSIRLILLSFTILYLFTPNAPDARLGPQETLLILFLSISFYFYVKVQQSTFTFNANYVILLLSFLLLSGSKESSLPLLLAIILSLAFIIPKTYKSGVLLLPFILIFFILLFQILKITHGAGYGTKPISVQLIINNINHIFDYVFMKGWASLLIGIALWSSIKSIHTFLIEHKISLDKNKIKVLYSSNYESINLFILLVVLCFAGYFIFSLLFWQPVLRYFYPLSFLYAIIFAFSINYLWVNVCNKNNMFILVVSLALGLFVYSNYYNLVNQYSLQYTTRNNEKKLLASIKSHLDSGGTISFVKTNEFTSKITIFFNDYLHHFHDKRNYGLINSNEKILGSKVLYLSYKPLNTKEFKKIQTFKSVTPKFIKFIQHIMPSKTVFHDAGLGKYPWYLSKKINY